VVNLFSEKKTSSTPSLANETTRKNKRRNTQHYLANPQS